MGCGEDWAKEGLLVGGAAAGFAVDAGWGSEVATPGWRVLLDGAAVLGEDAGVKAAALHGDAV